MKEQIITRAYILHTGELSFNQVKFSNFLTAYPTLMHEQSKDELARVIKANISKVSEDINPRVDSNELGDLLPPADTETKDFLIMVHNKPLVDVSSYLNKFRFKSAQNKKNIKNALFAVYGEDAEALGTGVMGEKPIDMGPTLEEGKDENTEIPNPTDEIQPMQSEPEDMTPPAEDMTTTLDPAVEEDAIFTIEGYLQTDVFNSKLIPTVKIVKAEQLKNGYVIHLLFDSKDGQSKAYATAVIHNKKLVLPAELYGDEGMNEKLGDFNQETFNNVFTVAEQKKNLPTDNYGELMDQMATAPSTVEANVVLEKILRKFGQEVAANAWESYIRRTAHQGPVAKPGVAERLDVFARTVEPPKSLSEAMNNLKKSEEE